jgi:lysozyme family protein
VNEGPGTANRHLQEALGVGVDGLVGPVTLNAALRADHTALIDKLAEIRTDYYKSLPKFPVFGHGWLNRVEAVTVAAKAMLTA